MSNDPDPATGLTNREKNIVRETWSVIKKDVRGNGSDLFVRFFTENPSFQAHFSSFKDVPISELKGNKKVLAHALSVLSAISGLVDNLDDPEVLVEMLVKTGGNHFRRSIKVEQFNALGVSIIGWLIEKCGTGIMDQEAINAWKKTYSVIVSVIQQGMDQAKNSTS